MTKAKIENPSFPMVVKGNELVDSSYNLTSVSHNILNAMFARIDSSSPDKLPLFEFNEAELAAFMRENNMDDTSIHKYSVKIVTELMQLSIFFREAVGETDYKLRCINVFAQSDIVYNKKAGKLIQATFEFTEQIAPYIRELTGNFTKYRLSIMASLDSKYAKRIYEILLKEHAISKTYKKSSTTLVKIGISDLKWKLGISDKYSKFGNFKTNILEVSKRQISKNTNIQFTYEPVKDSGKSYTHIKFLVTDNIEAEEVTEALLESMALPKIDPEIQRKIESFIPDFSAGYFPIISSFSGDLVVESLLELAQARIQHDIKKPAEYFMGILKKKAKAEHQVTTRKPQTTFEKLNDRSWITDEEL